MKTNKFVSLTIASLVAFTSFSFASTAQAADPAVVVTSPSFSVADDGTYTYVPGEWSGEVTTLTVSWYSCPTAQLGAIGDATELAAQLTDSGCTFVSHDTTLAADTFDNLTTFPVVMETANDTSAAFMGNNFVMYDKSVGPIAYSAAPQAAVVVARTLYFSGNSATLNAKSRAALNALLAKVGKSSKVVVLINGYAAKGGSAAKNHSIARGRARQVMFFFKRHAIAATYKIRLHTSKVSGAAGRKATVQLSITSAASPE